MYLLDLFCNSSNPNVRSRTAELFSKMIADKLIGPRVKIVLSKFLPSIFMDAMRDSPEASVHMFEGWFFIFLMLDSTSDNAFLCKARSKRHILFLFCFEKENKQEIRPTIFILAASKNKKKNVNNKNN